MKIDRIAAWTLLVGILLYFISGYGMTKGIIDPSLATKLHLSYLTYLVLTAFILHTSYAIHLAMKRWRIWTPAGKTILASLFLAFISFFIYADKFYHKSPGAPVKNDNTAASSAINNSRIILLPNNLRSPSWLNTMAKTASRLT